MSDTNRPTFVFRLTKQCVVDVQLSGPVTQEAIDKLIEVLQLVKDCYPEQAEISRQEGEQT